MRKKTFHVSLLTALLMTALAFAGTYSQSGGLSPRSATTTTTAQIEPFEPGYEVEKEEMVHGYSYPGRIDVKGDWDFTLSASFLYWQMMAGGLDFLSYYNSETSLYERIEFPFSYEPAFKVFAGMFFHNHDDWQLFADYTRHYSHNKCVATSRPGAHDSLVPAVWTTGSTKSQGVPKAEGHYHMGIDILNLSVGRYFYLGSHLILNPFLGARADWIHDKWNSKYHQIMTYTDPNGNQITEEFDLPSWYKTKSWALGPRVGLEARYLLGEGCRLFGRGAVSLVYKRSHLDGDLTYLDRVSGRQTNYEVKTYAVYNEKDSLLRPELELGLGFGWGTYLDSQNWNIDFSAGYDLIMIWNQQIMSSHFMEHLLGELSPNHVFLHGLTLSFAFDF